VPTPTDAYGLAVNADAPDFWWRAGADAEFNGLANGTVSGSPTTTTGLTPSGDNTATLYSAATAFITVAHQAALSLTGTTWSVEFWIKVPTPRQTGFPSPIGKGAGASGGWLFYVNGSTGSVNFKGATDTISGHTLVAGETAHIVFVRSGTGYIAYKNGVAGSLVTFAALAGTTASLLFNRSAEDVNAAGWTLDEIAIYTSVALTQTQITNHYTANPPITYQYARPDADTTTTGWTTTPLFSKINDQSNATVITATAS
jgi:hypothetical protein